LRIASGIFILFLTIRIWAVVPEGDAWKSISIQAPEPVSDIQIGDLNGDGELDLTVVHRDSIGTMVSAYFRNGDGFGGSPSASFWTDAAVYDVADVDGDRTKEIVLLDERSVRWIEWNHGTMSMRTIQLKFPAFVPADGNRLARWRLTIDADGDGLDEFAIPKSDGIVLLKIDSAGVVFSQQLCTRPASTIDDHMPLRWTTEAPEISTLDFNGDGHTDLLTTLGGRLEVFLRALTGTPEENTDHYLSILPDLHYQMTYHGLDSDILNLDPEETRLDVRDLDGDGLADVVVSRRSRLDFTNRMSAVGIHFNKKDRIDPVPDQVIAVENLGASYATGDWNGDGKIDLAIPRLNVGIEQAARVLLTREAEAAIDVYCLGENNRYPDDPDASIRFNAKPMIKDWIRDGFAVSACGDWNGDGKADLFVETGNSKRLVFLQHENLRFEKEPHELPPSGHSVIADLDRDGSDEILLWNDGSSEIRIIKHTAR
jgi:hypothetical protein